MKFYDRIGAKRGAFYEHKTKTVFPSRERGLDGQDLLAGPQTGPFSMPDNGPVRHPQQSGGTLIGPRVLGLVEAHSSLSRLLGTILFFTLALLLTQYGKTYLGGYNQFCLVENRTSIMMDVSRKFNTTGYPNTLRAEFLRLLGKTDDATDNNQSSTEEIYRTITSLLTNLGGLIAYLTILSGLNLWLLLFMAASCTGEFWAARYKDNWIYAHRDTENQFYLKKRYLRDKSESIELAKDIRIFGLQGWMRDILTGIHDAYYDFQLKVEKRRLLVDLVGTVCTVARNGIAYWYLIRLALRNGLGVPEFLLYFTAASTFTTWVLGILTDLSKLNKQSLDISQVREFLDYPEPFRGQAPVPKAAQYELRLEQVSFRYPEAEKDTITNMNLTIHPGERLAIVGLNGAGKTTLVKLLCGLLDPTEGRVLLNGQDIRTFDRAEYYRLFSAVFQDYSLLCTTVAENVAQTASHIDEEKVWDCLQKAGLAEAIQALPKGFIPMWAGMCS